MSTQRHSGLWWVRALLLALLVPSGALAEQPRCAPPLPVAAPGAKASVQDRGLLWRMTRNGRVSYLYGSLHVGKPAWSAIGPQVRAALRATDQLVLEIDPEDPALRQAFEADNEATSTASPELAAALALAIEAACLPPDALQSLPRVLQAATLVLLDARWLGLSPVYAQEQVLLAATRQRQRPVLALESPAQQAAALLPANATEAHTMLAQTLRQLQDGSARRVLARLAQVWEQGNLAALADYAAWCECVATPEEQAFMRRLNDERNPGLAAGIEALHRRGGRYFVAVGALHMTGPMALPKLLAARGFVLQRVRFKS